MKRIVSLLALLFSLTTQAQTTTEAWYVLADAYVNTPTVFFMGTADISMVGNGGTVDFESPNVAGFRLFQLPGPPTTSPGTTLWMDGRGEFSGVVNSLGVQWSGSSTNNLVLGIGNTLISPNNQFNNVILGGTGNIIRSTVPTFADGSVIAGGGSNANTNGLYGVISGGYQNSIASAGYATLSGGSKNNLTAAEGVIAGGIQNTNAGDNSVISGGQLNEVQDWKPVTTAKGFSTISGGYHNWIYTNAPAVAYGHGPFAPTYLSTICGGGYNAVFAPVATICGGGDNTNYGGGSFIGGGDTCFIGTNTFQAVIAGGYHNVISNCDHATISGGTENYITNATGSTIAGGTLNTISNATSAMIPGGDQNFASGNYSFAGGLKAVAINPLSFVWSGSVAGAQDTVGGQFVVAAPGGLVFNGYTGITTNVTISGVTLMFTNGILVKVQ